MIRIMSFIALTVSAYLSLTYFALFLRVLIGLVSDGGGAFASFIYAVTEPILVPIRRRLERIEILQDIPLDLSVLVALLLIMLLTFLLPNVV